MVGLGVSALLFVLVLAPVPLPAQSSTAQSGGVRTAVDLQAAQTVLLERNNAHHVETAAVSSTRAGVDFRGGDAAVRGWLRLEAIIAEAAGAPAAIVRVPRAEIRFRVPVAETNLRFTTGLTRLTWGDGVLYNAGDVINGARPQTVDLTAQELRTETQWLNVMYLPVGRFAFFEAVALLPPVDLTLAARAPEGRLTATVPAAWRSGGGARLQTQLGGLKMEGGYLYRGAQNQHAPYLSAQGNLFIDWYGAISTALEPDRFGARDPLRAAADNLALSAGLFHTDSIGPGVSLGARLEGLYRVEDRLLSLYPELTVAPSPLLSFFARATVTVGVDSSGVRAAATESTTGLGVVWRPATGLDVIGSVTAFSGGAAGSSREGAAAIGLAVRYGF